MAATYVNPIHYKSHRQPSTPGHPPPASSGSRGRLGGSQLPVGINFFLFFLFNFNSTVHPTPQPPFNPQPPLSVIPPRWRRARFAPAPALVWVDRLNSKIIFQQFRIFQHQYKLTTCQNNYHDGVVNIPFLIRASWRSSLFVGESGTFLLKIIICIKSGTLLGNIFFFWGGGGIFTRSNIS